MHITFDPPLGQTARVAITTASSCITLTFTARVDAKDYTVILNDGGGVQLWSNLPFGGVYDGTWQEAQFTQPDNPVPIPSNSCDISLDNQQGEDTVLLTAEVNLIPIKAIDKAFQFTYRIKYEGGSVHWLGNFGINGYLVLEQCVDDFGESFTLFEGWQELKQGSWILHINSDYTQKKVAKIDVSRYRVWSLGIDSLLSEPKAASMLFLIPRHEKSLVRTPTYILSASCGLTITLLAPSTIAVSGTGSLSLEMPDLQSDMKEGLTALFMKCGMESWCVLATDAQSHSVAIGTNGCPDSVQAVILPLWSSPWSRRSVLVPYPNIISILGESSTRNIAVFSSYRLQVWIFSEEDEVESVSLTHTSTGSVVVIAPLHSLTPSRPNKGSRLWAASIFSKHRTLNVPCDPQRLPTPPPSPGPVPNDVSTEASPYWDLISSRGFFQSITSPSKNSRFPSEPSTQSYASYFFSWNKHRASQGFLCIFKSIFASLSVFLRVFFRIFGYRSTTASTTRPPSTQSSKVSNLPNNQRLPFNRRNGVATHYGGVSDGNRTLPDVLSSVPLHDEHPSPMNDRKLVAELQCDEGDLHLNRGTLAVALIPLSHDVDHQAAHENGIERSLAFMDGSNLQCAVSKCSAVFVRRRGGVQPSLLEGSCSLLEYEVDWQNLQSKAVIEVRSP